MQEYFLVKLVFKKNGTEFTVARSPALPVKNTFLPLSTALRTAACSLFSFREGRDRMGFLFGLAFT